MVVRACEAALILVSLPSIVIDCCAVDLSLRDFCTKLAEHVGNLCQAIPEDMYNGDIEDCKASWGFVFTILWPHLWTFLVIPNLLNV